MACYHSKVGAVELLLNHLLDGPDEYVVVDMTAGADSFASGLFTRFDRTFLVCEPTVRSVSVYRQYAGYARDYGVALSVIGNKVEDATDVEFLREHVGADLLTWMSRSAYVRRAERGTVGPLDDLEEPNRAVLSLMADAVDGTTQDWTAFTRWATSSTDATPRRGPTSAPESTSPRRSTRTSGWDRPRWPARSPTPEAPRCRAGSRRARRPVAFVPTWLTSPAAYATGLAPGATSCDAGDRV
ncbi:hypothetical protein [Verrucosispora sp. WMMD1129]|uniref:hypothetical protein n=1 Tax=Verrucosispora sp. WMMD1129 TaxID=3016093 RepID=UPI00249B2BD0|nr:hypothetical protein [Verrucosispora sp. WMMD1129]WFE48793.1 hypothetical protein O7624_01945 [Verrucosispora sp. WMMD1129]